MKTEKKQFFRELGRMFYEWHKTGRVRFVYGVEGGDLDIEIERLSQLIEYVRKKKKTLLQGEMA